MSIRMRLLRDMNRYPKDWNLNRSTGFLARVEELLLKYELL